MKQKRYIKAPTQVNGQWRVVVADSLSPIANEIEVIECPGGRESAWKTYRRMKKQSGKGF